METCERCGSEKNFQSFCSYYRRCKVCNSAVSLKYYYKNRERILKRLKEDRENNKSCLNKERNGKYKTEINTLKDQIQLLTNRLDTMSM